MSETLRQIGDPPPARQPRQVIRFTTFAELVAVAQGLFAAGVQPKNVDRPEKLIPMLLTGAELGLGIMQSVKFITPPANGVCSLWGDMGLALVRQSGQLERFEESIVGDGDERKAVCTVKRSGYPARTFEYGLKLAKTLKSYQAAYKVDAKSGRVGGGPWYDDPDNMLMWRARWRALRTEFTDVLNGLGGAEEQDQEQPITVEVTHVTALPAEQTTVHTPDPAIARLPAQLQSPSAVPEPTLAELGRLRRLLLEQRGELDGKTEWSVYLAGHGKASARDLTAEQAEVMCGHFGRMCDPFGYPAGSSVTLPASGPESSAS
jgi:hypothetical protein